MDEGTGTVITDSTGRHDLTITGGPSRIRDAGHAVLLFAGAGQSADSIQPVLDTVGPFTVAARVRLDRSGSFATAVSQDGGGTSAFFLQYSQPAVAALP